MMLGTIPLLAVRLMIPWTGAWVADCTLTEASSALPSGQQTLTIGSTSLLGTIDPRGSGTLGETRVIRLVGGAGAWGNIVQRFHLHNDGAQGVTSAQVLANVAKQIGETVVDANPVTYPVDFEFLTGPAVGALEGRQWYVDGSGVTQVANWPTVPLGSDADVLHFDPSTRRAEASADEIIWPGTVITDSRFGTITARDIDQRFTKEGSRVTIHFGTAATGRFNPLLAAIATLGGQQWLKVYRYRISTQGSDGRLQLQAVDASQGQPDTLPLSVWPGMAGLSAKYTLGQLCSVVFLEGNKSLPRVISFDGQKPQEFYIDATALARIEAPTIKLGANASQGAARVNDVVHGGFLLISSTGTIITASTSPGRNGWYPPTAAGKTALNTDIGANPGSVFIALGTDSAPTGPVGAGLAIITSGSGKTKVE